MSVDTVHEARNMLSALAAYDAFQFEHNIKPDYCNAGGLQVFSETDCSEWVEWEDEFGNSIDDADMPTAEPTMSAQAEPAKAQRQYFYMVPGTDTSTGMESIYADDARCWHDEGTGPLADEPYLIRTWRAKP